MFQPCQKNVYQGSKKINVATCPGLKTEIISRHLQKPEANISENLDQRKTKQISKKSENRTGGVNICFPLRGETKNSILSAIGQTDPDTGKLYTDLSGRFPLTSDRAMQYMLILHAYDTNILLVEPIKTRSDTDMLCAYDVLYKTLENLGHAPKLYIMDN